MSKNDRGGRREAGTGSFGARIFKEGTADFKGGPSAENYISITAMSRAKAAHDLQKLVEIGAPEHTGERRNTR